MPPSASKWTASSPSLTRWSSHAPRNTSRRSQWTSERSAGPTSSGQHSLTWSPSAGGRLEDLAVDGEVDEVFQLLLFEAVAHEAELDRGLLAALGEVNLVEGEAKLPVFEDEVLSGIVIFASCGFHSTNRAVVLGARSPSGS